MSALNRAQVSIVSCTDHLYLSRATSGRVLFRSSGEQLWLLVNGLGSTSLLVHMQKRWNESREAPREEQSLPKFVEFRR